MARTIVSCIVNCTGRQRLTISRHRPGPLQGCITEYGHVSLYHLPEGEDKKVYRIIDRQWDETGLPEPDE